MILTSYYAKNLPEGVEGIAISVGLPRWWRGKTYTALAPRREWLKLPPEEYDPLFNALLGRLEPALVYRELVELAAPKTPCLLCWCGPKAVAACHRSLCRVFLSQAGPVEELA